jgi:large subunit ribosomal protein L29
MKAREIRRRSSADLREEVKRLRQQAFEKSFRGQSEEKADRGFHRRTRREVARILGILREREIGLSAEPAGGKKEKE